MTKIIERNTTIPVEKKQVFSTAADNQPGVEIHILQGEREMASDNKTLGKFVLDGLPPAPRGVPQIEVSFSIDANGILNVKAVDKATNKEQKVTITASTGLTDQEIEKMVAEAAEHAKEDKEKREKAEIRNEADTLVFSSEKLLKENEEKVEKDVKEKIEAKIKELKDLLAKEDSNKDEIKKLSDELSSLVQEVGKKLYEQASKEEPKKDEDKNEKKDEKAQEGEVVE